MAEKKFSQLTAKGATIADTDLVAISESAGGGTYVSKSVTGANIKALVTDANLVTSDITTNNVSITKHGFVPKAPNDTSQYLRGDGTWASVSSGLTVGTTAVTSGTVGRIFFQGSGDVVQQDSTLFWDNTNKRLGIGATPSSAVRLDVRAQGALSTDLAFRVRNSADTRNLFSIAGNKTIEMIAETPATNGGISITGDVYNSPTINTYDAFGNNEIRIDAPNRLISAAGAGSVRIGSHTGDGFMGMVTPSSQNRFLRLVDVFGGQWLELGGSSYDGTGMNFTMKAATNDNTNYIRFRGFNNANEVVISDQANVGIGGTTFGTGAKYVKAQFTGTAPSTSPADAYQQYSADIVAGNAAPHFRTENGTIIKLYQNSAVTTTQGVADALTNLGVLASSTIVPTVQSVTSAATVTAAAGNDLVVITAQAVGLTLANPSGTWQQGQALMIRIKDNGTARTIGYGTNYRAIGVTLPTTTVASKTTYLGVIYNSTDTKWDVIGVTTEA